MLSGSLIHCQGNVNWKISNPKKWKTGLLYDSATPLLGINLKDSEWAHHRCPHTHIYCCTIHKSQDKELV